jgi:DNA (cytosine-5)-methyltransferase 1
MDVMTELWALDLFCGGGGMTKGFQRAGFKVLGVDHKKQKRYCGEKFIQGDALAFLASAIESGFVEQFVFVHASPPCQGYSRMRHLPWLKGKKYPMLIPQTRELLQLSGKPYTMENVEGAPLEDLPLYGSHAIRLCGTMFGLKLYRHRLFESNVPLTEPQHRRHQVAIGGAMLNSRQQPTADGWVSLPAKAKRKCSFSAIAAGATNFNGLRDSGNGVFTVAGHFSGIAAAKAAMGIDWMTRDELGQAIPPAFAEYIARQLRARLNLDD